MWIRGKTLDLLILSIFKDSDLPLTGYSIAKEIERQFAPFASPSPGTIYPRLKKLEANGDLQAKEEENSYMITPQGIQTLETSMKDIMENAANSWNILFKSFYQNLSYPRKFKFMDKFGDFYDLNLKSFQTCCKHTETMTTEEITLLIDQFKTKKAEITEKTEELLQQLDKNIAHLTEELERKQEERKKPTIIWDDDE